MTKMLFTYVFVHKTHEFRDLATFATLEELTANIDLFLRCGSQTVFGESVRSFWLVMLTTGEGGWNKWRGWGSRHLLPGLPVGVRGAKHHPTGVLIIIPNHLPTC